MTILINLKEEQKNSSSILGTIGLNTSCSAVLLMQNSSLFFAAVLEGQGEILGKQREVAWMRQQNAAQFYQKSLMISGAGSDTSKVHVQ